MQMNKEDEYAEISRLLKNLKKIEAPVNFREELNNRLSNSNKKFIYFAKENTKKLLPSLALAFSVILVAIIFNLNSAGEENPLLLQPKEKTENPVLNKQNESNAFGSSDESIEFNYMQANFKIDKAGLNFRRIHIPKEEKMLISKLKQRLFGQSDKYPK